jgi:Kef-type K+ transport system membrane component KefB
MPSYGESCCQLVSFPERQFPPLFLLKRWQLLLLGTLFLIGSPGEAGAAASGDSSLLSSISISILAATLCALGASLLRQPLILAYLAAGMLIGPEIGFAWVQNKQDIQIIAEIGLILLLFLIGLELDLRKLKEAGKSLILTGSSQFVLCLALGLGFFWLLGFTVNLAPPHLRKILGVSFEGGPYDLLYLAACLGLSSTAIVVKLLYEKFELDTLAGRITLGVLVFQDLWAIVLLSLQPNLAQPQILTLIWSFAKGAFLVLVSFLLSRYLLAWIFRTIAKLPELMLAASLGWCFFVSGLANHLGLSLEMGALIAGVSLSTFPYNLDIIGKIINIRDFFITLFFVALGMVIPHPLKNPGLLLISAAVALFLVFTRFVSVYPLLYVLGNGNRVSLLATINLSQLSEFALVIAVIGLKPEYRHIGPDTLTVIIFVFVITSVASTYMIQFNQELQAIIGRLLEKLGLRSLGSEPGEKKDAPGKDLALLGFFRVASAFLAQVEQHRPELLNRLVVVDFNPEVYTELRKKGIKVVYGDISNLKTLQHAGLEAANVVMSTITDDILVGIDNFKLIGQVRRLCPQAKVVVTAVSPTQALKLYRAGADYVLCPNQVTAGHLLKVLECLLSEWTAAEREEEIRKLTGQKEVLP